MGRFYNIIVCLFVIYFLGSCKSEVEVQIKGEISNLESPRILVSYLSADTLVIDTVSVNEKGKFIYKNKVDTLTTFTLYLDDYESAAVVFADKGEVLKVKGDAMFPDLIKVSGNEVNEDLTLFKIENQDLLTQRGQLLLSLSTELNSDSVIEKSMTRNDDILKLQLLDHKLVSQAEDFIKRNPTRFSSLILINNFFVNSDNSQGLERVLGYLEDDVLETPLATRLNFYLEKINRSAEGARMPYFMLKDKEEKEIYSHDFNGKHLLLSFVSTAGIESRETIEMLKEAYKEVDSDSVKFLTVYIDSDIYPIDYVENDSIPWTIVPEKKSWGSDIVDIYNVQYVPFNILIAPNGNIKVRNIPAQEVAKAIKNSTED